jgi:bifunctional UDP-N-acetylglucosamine pyrophosphorylase/glucosamine-1-phosphate N-acetyltransferase
MKSEIERIERGMQLTSKLQVQHAVLEHQAIDVVIMAAGKGTRMKSRLPKVLHPLAGRPLLRHVLDTAQALQARQAVVITGHGAMEVEAACAIDAGAADPFVVNFVRQEPQLGTGHAVQQAVPVLADDGVVLILSGDVPMTRAVQATNWRC